MLMQTRMGLPVALLTACASYQLRCHSMRQGFFQSSAVGAGQVFSRSGRGGAACGAGDGAGPGASCAAAATEMSRASSSAGLVGDIAGSTEDAGDVAPNVRPRWRPVNATGLGARTLARVAHPAAPPS